MTIATSIGRTIGRVAATSVHAAVVGAQYTGHFGADLAAGTSAGYVDHTERLAAKRAARNAERGSIAVQVVVPTALKSKLAKA